MTAGKEFLGSKGGLACSSMAFGSYGIMFISSRCVVNLQRGSSCLQRPC